MNSQEKFLLSSYLIKSAISGAALMGGLRTGARSSLQRATQNAAALGVLPTGGALARQGLRDLTTGAMQAASSGLRSAGRGVANAGRAVGRGTMSIARNPFAQGLAGGALGTFALNKLMAGGAPAQQPNTAPSAPALSSAGSPVAGVNQKPGIQAIAPAAMPVPAAPAAAAMTDAELDEQGVQMTAPVSAPAVAANNDNSLRDVFGQYMGGSYNANSALDRAKFKYLQDLQSKGLSLNAANIYNKSLGYGNWKL